jgi:hypothetical protein
LGGEPKQPLGTWWDQDLFCDQAACALKDEACCCEQAACVGLVGGSRLGTCDQ